MTIDTSSATWRHVQEWATGEIEELGRQNETSGMPITETEHLRGRIKELRALLALPHEAVEQREVVTNTDYNFQGAEDIG